MKKYKKMKVEKRTIRQIRNFCRSLYYIQDFEGKEIRWIPFTQYEDVFIEEYIENDTESLCRFLGIKYIIKKDKVYPKKKGN